MFLFIPGRILFELATCIQLDSQKVFPTMEQIEEITDEQLRYLLKYIFERSQTKISHSLEEVCPVLYNVINSKYYNFM